MSTTKSVASPPPLPRGPEYDARIQRLLKHGSLQTISTNYITIRQLHVAPSGAHHYVYGLACFRCETISWEPDYVAARYCPTCAIYLDA
jgi:hypothetical protein